MQHQYNHDQLITWLDQTDKINKKIRMHLLAINTQKQAPELLDVDSPLTAGLIDTLKQIFAALDATQYPVLYFPLSAINDLAGTETNAAAARIMRKMNYRVTKSRRFTYPVWNKKTKTIVNFQKAHSACYELHREFFEEKELAS